MSSEVTITIVTPWLDHLELAAAYFEAVEVMNDSDELCIVDNGSTPKLDFADIRLEHNEGVHFANNIGLRTASTDAVLFLNNDVELEDECWLATIREHLNVGVFVGAALRSDYHTMVDGHAEPYLDGWCLAGMKSDLLSIGGWDETLDEPAYFGDNLLALAARRKGIKLLQVDVELNHLGSTTSRSHCDWSDVAHVTNKNRRIYIQAVRDMRARVAEQRETVAQT